ncbi:hypothetical protein ACFVYP_09920 [Kitasatospora sp. NPDC058201]|uniref:hypothetical protein n=1 Tax=unclassified Kitasatospora TaxID=2633591 RepID=UPI00365E3555
MSVLTDLALTGAVALAAGWIVERRHLARARKLAGGATARVMCMVRNPPQEGRWRTGRLLIGPDGVVWRPVRGRAGARPLPTGLRKVGMRRTTWRERVRIRSDAVVVEFASEGGERGEDGALEVALMPYDVAYVVTALTGE